MKSPGADPGFTQVKSVGQNLGIFCKGATAAKPWFRPWFFVSVSLSEHFYDIEDKY